MNIFYSENISTMSYSFDQQALELDESIQLERQIQKVSTSCKTYYRKLTAHPMTCENTTFHTSFALEITGKIDPSIIMIPAFK